MPANVSTIVRPGATLVVIAASTTDPGDGVVAQNHGKTNGAEGRALLQEQVLP